MSVSVSQDRPTFDYSQLGMHEVNVKHAAYEIRSKVRASVSMMIEAGQDLQRIKRTIGHGLFQEWIAAEFPWSERTVERWIQLAVLSDKTDTVSVLPATTLYKLTAKSTPPEAREVILSRLESGEIAGDEQVLGELRRLTRAVAAQAAVAPSIEGIAPGHEATEQGNEKKIKEEEGLEEEGNEEEDEDQIWARQMRELVAVLTTGLGDRGEALHHVIRRIDGNELLFYYQEHLLALKRARGAKA